MLYDEHLTFENPKFIYVDGIKVEVEEIIIGHSTFYYCDIDGNNVCKDSKTRIWKLKETIPLDLSKFYVVNDDGKQYTCYVSENRKTLIKYK